MRLQLRVSIVLGLCFIATTITPAQATGFKPDGTFPNDSNGVYMWAFLDDTYITPGRQENIQLLPKSAINLVLAVSTDTAPAEATSLSGTLTFRPYNPAHARRSWSLKLDKVADFCQDSGGCRSFYYQFDVTPTETGTWVFGYDGWPSLTEPEYVSQTIEILNTSPRATVDAPDSTSGYQVHVVYVKPFGELDNHRDEYGEIGDWLDQASSLLDRGFGKHWNWDKRKDGKYDITFFQSQYTMKDLQPGRSAIDLLSNEYAPMRTLGANRKTYLFVVDGDSQNGLCGYTLNDNLSRSAFILTGPNFTDITSGSACSGSTAAMALPTYQVKGIVHELLHTLGVTHVNDKYDLMCGAPYNCTAPYDNLHIDPDHKFYNGANARGVNVLQQRIWSANPKDPKQEWTCQSSESALQAKSLVLCGGGTNRLPYKTIRANAPCFSPTQTGALEQLVNGKWKQVGKLTNYLQEECAYNLNGLTNSLSGSISGKTGSKATYRFRIGSTYSSSFTAIFQD